MHEGLAPTLVPGADGTSAHASRLDRLLAWARRRLATRGGFALLFLLLFCAGLVPALFTCLVCGKSLLWQIDGVSEQYVWYVYVGQWIRELLSNVFVTHSFEIPLWDFSSGYGADVIQTMGGFLVNPLWWTSALLPERFAEFGLELVSLLLLYGAGLTFAAWALGRGVSRGGALIGSLVYVFSGYSAVLFSQQSFFVTLALFPVVLACADRVFERRGPLPFVLVLAWCLASSFYDSYMMLILLVCYCLVRFFDDVEAGRPRKGKAVRLLGWAGLFVALVMLALLLSSVLMLPQVMALTGTERLELGRSDGPLYALSWYAGLFTNLFGVSDMGGDAYFGLNAVAPAALVLLVARRREHRGLLVAFCVLTLMLLLPAFGSLMNGLEYASNRWSWAYALLVAYVVALLLPEVAHMTTRERRVAAGVVIGYAVLLFCLPLPGRSASSYASLLVAAVALAVALSARAWPRPRLMAALACCAALSGAVALTCYLSPYFDGWVKNLTGVGRAWTFHASLAAEGLVEQAEEAGVDYDETYRYDRTTSVSTNSHNSSVVTGLLSTDYYNSIYNQGVDDFNTSLGLVDSEGTNFRHGSLNARSMVEALLGVRYFYLDQGSSVILPETFRDGTVIAEGPGRGDYFYLYETDLVAPLAFGTGAYLTRSEYESLPMVDRQRALLAGVVLEDDDAEATADASGLTDVAEEVAASANAESLAYEVAEACGCEVVSGEDPASLDVTARCAGATLRLTFASPADAEVYLMVTGLTYEDISYRERYTNEEWEALGFIGRLKARLAEPFRAENTNGPVGVGTSAWTSTIFQMNAGDHMYGSKHDWMVNLGYAEDGLTELTLTFVQPGTYSFGSLEVVAQPMEGVDERIEALADAGAADITLGTNVMSATSTSDEDGLMFWSVAYSEGWSATVDGEPAEVLKADLGFMAVEVPAGEHEVRLSYETPWLREGALLSLAGVAGTVVACLVARLLRRRAFPRADVRAP